MQFLLALFVVLVLIITLMFQSWRDVLWMLPLKLYLDLGLIKRHPAEEFDKIFTQCTKKSSN